MDRTFSAPLLHPHAAKIMGVMGSVLLWMWGCGCFFGRLSEQLVSERPGVLGVLAHGWAALYTPAVWLDGMLGAWLDDPEGLVDRQRLFVLCFAQIIPVVMRAVAGRPRSAAWREGLVAYLILWACLAVAGFVQLRMKLMMVEP